MQLRCYVFYVIFFGTLFQTYFRQLIYAVGLHFSIRLWPHCVSSTRQSPFCFAFSRTISNSILTESFHQSLIFLFYFHLVFVSAASQSNFTVPGELKSSKSAVCVVLQCKIACRSFVLLAGASQSAKNLRIQFCNRQRRKRLLWQNSQN